MAKATKYQRKLCCETKSGTSTNAFNSRSCGRCCCRILFRFKLICEAYFSHNGPARMVGAFLGFSPFWPFLLRYIMPLCLHMNHFTVWTYLDVQYSALCECGCGCGCICLCIYRSKSSALHHIMSNYIVHITCHYFTFIYLWVIFLLCNFHNFSLTIRSTVASIAQKHTHMQWLVIIVCNVVGFSVWHLIWINIILGKIKWLS